MRSPNIVRIAWGEIEVEGFGRFKDAKLFPGGARAWDWNETGTRHSPGIQPADAEELVAAGATVVILSRGVDLRLQVPAETVSFLQDKGVTVHVLRTPEAADLYNTLSGSEAVGALLHSTC